MQKSDLQLFLEWNDFEDDMSSALGDLSTSKDFTDVTLACEDGKLVEAHEVILKSSSLFAALPRSKLQESTAIAVVSYRNDPNKEVKKEDGNGDVKETDKERSRSRRSKSKLRESKRSSRSRKRSRSRSKKRSKRSRSRKRSRSHDRKKRSRSRSHKKKSKKERRSKSKESKKEIKRDYDQEEAGYEQKEEKKDPVDMEISNSP